MLYGKLHVFKCEIIYLSFWNDFEIHDHVVEVYCVGSHKTWWRHQMEKKTFSASLALCEGNSPVTGEFPSQRPVTRSVDVFFDLHLNKWLSIRSWGWWFDTLSRPLLRHSNEMDFGTYRLFPEMNQKWQKLPKLIVSDHHLIKELSFFPMSIVPQGNLPIRSKLCHPFAYDLVALHCFRKLSNNVDNVWFNY